MACFMDSQTLSHMKINNEKLRACATARASLGSKRKLRRRRGACYTESNRSIQSTIPNDEAHNTRQQTKTTSNADTLPSSQDLRLVDFFPDNFSDNLARVPVSDDPMAPSAWNQWSDDPLALFNWSQWGDTVDEPTPAPFPSFELLGSTKGHEDTRCKGLDTDQRFHDDTHYCCNANNLSGDYVMSASATVTEKTPYFDHIRSNVYCWVLKSIRKSHENENTRIIAALQGLLTPYSLITNKCSSQELDIISVLIDLRSQRSFNKELFYKRIEACFAELHGSIGIFLDLATVYALVDQVLLHPLVSNPTCIALFFSVLAIGSRRLDLSHSTGTINGATIGFFRIALRMKPHPCNETNLLRLQTLLSLTYFSYAIGANSTSSLMAEATSGLQTLRLHSCNAIDKLSSDRLEQARIKRAFWAIYSMEKPYCLQEGLLPRFVQQFYDKSTPNGKVGKITHAAVEEQIANTTQPLPLDNLSALPCDERRRRLTYINKYHFAVIAIHSLPETENTDMSKGIRYKSAREILNMSAHLSWADLCDNWSLCYVVSLATCIVAARIIEKVCVVEAQRDIATTTGIRSNEHSYESGIETDISYIGIAIGFFSRVSLSTTPGFGAAAMKLCSFALGLAKS
ncbi:hypothetical protein COCSADRAFT_343184 [Bipolaris sorokiniana ND90Pr]|uniref:Transcription factor domain-containing protein n=1 Tax=Cochliobolus sativus (strain ND90Pr / ATCC 201652) TaxID=665912 RepID=M2T165_COCSN|nr:uncharacterized protein COCSADRAFT_343184 [Bipolaris sorokiniana ND90Pr]EMD62757.1 hypothetical protein COCSADRAFT_343184 [Bipolaris sorokiniana ND90Pr]